MEQRQQTCTNSIVPQLIKAKNVDPKKCILLLYGIYSCGKLGFSTQFNICLQNTHQSNR